MSYVRYDLFIYNLLMYLLTVLTVERFTSLPFQYFLYFLLVRAFYKGLKRDFVKF